MGLSFFSWCSRYSTYTPNSILTCRHCVGTISRTTIKLPIVFIYCTYTHFFCCMKPIDNISCFIIVVSLRAENRQSVENFYAEESVKYRDLNVAGYYTIREKTLLVHAQLILLQQWQKTLNIRDSVRKSKTLSRHKHPYSLSIVKATFKLSLLNFGKMSCLEMAQTMDYISKRSLFIYAECH